jgi:hypothetical protein
MKALPKGRYIKHFQYGLGVITESGEQSTSIDSDIHGIMKFVNGLTAVDPTEGTLSKHLRPKCSKEVVGMPLPAATAGIQ